MISSCAFMCVCVFGLRACVCVEVKAKSCTQQLQSKGMCVCVFVLTRVLISSSALCGDTNNCQSERAHLS